MTELYGRTKFSTITILNHVNSLTKAGLLEDEREIAFPRRRLLKVSKEGTRVAKLLNLADQSLFDPSDLIDMGARAGRIVSYQETISALKGTAATRERVIAEMLLKGIGALSSAISLVAKGLPAEMTDNSKTLSEWATKLEARYNEGQKRLSSNDVNGCVSMVSKALTEFNGAADLMAKVKNDLKERRMDELANYVEFLRPKTP
jgi:hypothetical protein